MSKSLSTFICILFILAPSSLFGMEPDTIKIQTSDEQEFEIALPVAQQSETLKKLIEDIGEEAEQSIPLPEISKKQFDLLLPAMLQLAQLRIARPQPSEAVLARQLEKTFADLTPNNQPLSNQQLIEFISGANFFKIPLVEPALKALSQRMLNTDELKSFKDLWNLHLAKSLMVEALSLKHTGINGAISRDGNLVSWSREKGTIKIWDKNNLFEEPLILLHSGIDGVIESDDGKILISWSCSEGTIKVWDKNNLFAKSITLMHLKVDGVMVTKEGNLVSWSKVDGRTISMGGWPIEGGTIKIWNKNTFEELVILKHPKVDGAIESGDGKNLISWSRETGIIIVWDMDKDNLAKFVTLNHSGVSGVISRDGNIISWSNCAYYSIKVWDANNLLANPVTLAHQDIDGVRMNGNNLISWSEKEGTIKVWDRKNLDAEPTILRHPQVKDVIESLDGDNLISWSNFKHNCINVWNKRNFTADPITRSYFRVYGVIETLSDLISWGAEIKIAHKANLAADSITLDHPGISGAIKSSDSKNLISWSRAEGTIKVWDTALLDTTPEQILLFLAAYFSKSDQKFELPDKKLSELKATFNTLSPITQAFLEKRAPNFIAAIKSKQE